MRRYTEYSVRQLALRLTGGGVDGHALGPSLKHDPARLVDMV
jgi:hypothetical protein